MAGLDAWWHMLQFQICLGLVYLSLVRFHRADLAVRDFILSFAVFSVFRDYSEVPSHFSSFVSSGIASRCRGSRSSCIFDLLCFTLLHGSIVHFFYGSTDN